MMIDWNQGHWPRGNQGHRLRGNPGHSQRDSRDAPLPKGL